MEIRIGDLAKRSGCEVVTIRYYEKEGLLPKPARSGGNFIRHCRSLDMTLSEIRALLGLRDNPMQDCGEVITLLEAHIQQVEMRVSALLQLKRHLVDLREKCSGSRSVEACGILQGLGNCHGESATNSQTSG
ncbi:TPA: Cd(II)/Pb(II)-responsive transcriptional regulator [Klebsiella pneumoniae]